MKSIRISVTGVAFATTALFFTAAHADSLSDKPGAQAAPAAVVLNSYDCVATGGQTARVGQVIKNVYHEWVQTTRAGDTGTVITCITQMKPAAGQLNRDQASALLTDSQNIAPTAPTATGSAATAASAAALRASVLPRGVDAQGTAKAMAAPDSSAAPPTTNEDRTTPQQLSTSTAPERTAILDLGYGSTPLSKRAASQQAPDTKYERPATIGTDDRSHVGDKSVFPWFLIGQLITTWKDGTQTICTGVLVSSHVVLSAGQCGHNRDHGGFASKVSFAPGQSQATPTSGLIQPYGLRYADYVETNNRWTQLSGTQAIQTIDARSDYAAFYFISSWAVTDTYMPIAYGDTTGGVVNTAGYPTDAPGAAGLNQDMWYSSGTETPRSQSFLRSFQVREYSMDISAGEGGAPIWNFDGTTRKITGLVSYGGDDVAGGVWFGGENQTIVSAFVAWTPSQAGPTHLADRLQVPMAVPSGDLNSDSYIRLYNPTPQAGTVSISIADAESGAALGTWSSPSLPAFSSLQYAVKDLESGAGVNPAGHDRYTLSMSATFPGFFQHVLWNRGGQSFTNTSGCGNGLSNDVLHMNNVHSTRIPDYPSVIFVHNTGTKGSDAIIGVYDAANGQRIGAVVIPAVPAGASAAFGIGDVEGALGFTPGPSQFHYNLVLESDFPGYLQHLVYNNKAGMITNLTPKCAFPLH